MAIVAREDELRCIRKLTGPNLPRISTISPFSSSSRSGPLHNGGRRDTCPAAFHDLSTTGEDWWGLLRGMPASADEQADNQRPEKEGPASVVLGQGYVASEQAHPRPNVA